MARWCGSGSVRDSALTASVALAHGLGCAPPASDPPLLRVVAHDYAFAAPVRAASGLTRVRLVNQGARWHHALLVRLDSTSAQAYVAGVQAGDSLPTGATDVGGPPLVPAGDSVEVLLELQPGRYLLTCWTSGGTRAPHIKHGMARELVVDSAPASGARHPDADVVVRMEDHAFSVSPHLRAGTLMIQVENVGRDYHELDVVRLAPGASGADYWAWKRAHQIGPAPGVPVGGTSDFGRDGRTWFVARLTPGRYLLICDMHAESHGMMREVDLR
jgi:hypothetical protein